MWSQGKNFERTFTHPKCGVRAKYPKFDSLLKLQAKYDPTKMFESRLFSKVANRESFSYTPGCRWVDSGGGGGGRVFWGATAADCTAP